MTAAAERVARELVRRLVTADELAGLAGRGVAVERVLREVRGALKRPWYLQETTVRPRHARKFRRAYRIVRDAFTPTPRRPVQLGLFGDARAAQSDTAQSDTAPARAVPRRGHAARPRPVKKSAAALEAMVKRSA